MTRVRLIGLRRENNDVAGIGVSWGKPADGTLREQLTSDFFLGLSTRAEVFW
jgi:hypothetical protein